MMPQLVTIHIREDSGRRFRFWVPLLPVALVLSPLLVVASVVATVACLAGRINTVRAFDTGARRRCRGPGSTSSRAAGPCS
jgi:hypothetical protein